MRRVTLAMANGMVTSGLCDLLTSHGYRVLPAGPDLSTIGPCDATDVVVSHAGARCGAQAQRLRKSYPDLSLILLDDSHMTVYPAGPENPPYRSPLTEAHVLSAVAATPHIANS